MNAVFQWACPSCGAPLEEAGEGGLRCPTEGRLLPCHAGIRRLMTAERQVHLERFVADYAEVRRREGRGSTDPEDLRALPFRDASGRHRREWGIRATSFRCLARRVVSPAVEAVGGPLRVADLGAGNGWLANRLALAGHTVAAVDLNVDPADGLGACQHYASRFEAVQADFDALPFADTSLDLVVFNGSLHYSTDYAATLGEALRTLRPGGVLAVLDSPVYADPASGRAMLLEMHEGFKERFGVDSDALPCRGFLTRSDLTRLSEELGLEWRSEWPFYGLRWSARPFVARLLGRREPASFGVLWATRPGAGP